MALAFGGGVRPELGRTDYSAIARGSEIAAQLSAQGSQMVGQGLAKALEGAGKAIANYQEKKQLKEFKNEARSALAEYATINPDIWEKTNFSPDVLDDPAQSDILVKSFSEKGDYRDGFANLSKFIREDIEKKNAETRNKEQGAAIGRALTAQGNSEMASAINQGVTFEGLTDLSTAPRPLSMEERAAKLAEAGVPPTGISQILNSFTSGRELDSRINQPTALSAPEAEINRLVDLGIPRDKATRIVSGVARISINPVNGDVTIVDMSTGMATPVSQPTPDEPKQPSPPDEGRSIAERAVASTGLGKSAIIAVQRAVGLGLDLVGLDATIPGAAPIIEARQFIDANVSKLIRALSVNPKYPVSELDRIRKDINITPGAFTDPETLRARILGVDEAIQGLIEAEDASAKNMRLPLQDRQAAAVSAENMRQFQITLGADRVRKMPKGSELQTTPSGVQFRVLEQ